MCLGIPGQIKTIVDRDRAIALVVVSGVERKINVTCIADPDKPLDALIGSWVLLHVGFAMSIIDEAEAAKTLEVLTELGEAQAELEAMMRDGSEPQRVQQVP